MEILSFLDLLSLLKLKQIPQMENKTVKVDKLYVHVDRICLEADSFM